MTHRRRRKQLPVEPATAEITGYAHDGRGLAHLGDRTVFIQGALPGETVNFLYTEMKRDVGEGYVVEVLQASPDRVDAQCPHYGVCGGCNLQHLDASKQIISKQGILLEQLRRLGKVEPAGIFPPLTAASWGYRSKARMGVRYVARKERVLVGFRERMSGWLADMHVCPVLDEQFGLRLDALSELIAGLALRDKIPQIEVAAGDDVAALVFRILDDASASDLSTLKQFGLEHGLDIYTQRNGPDSMVCISDGARPLSYGLPAYDIRFEFEPGDFTQVNLALNRQMVDRVVAELRPQSDERLLDLFCGLGNFTLPLARYAAHVVGVEGGSEAVKRAQHNAALNQMVNVEFHVADLTQPQDIKGWAGQRYDSVLLDPSRAGALEVLDYVSHWQAKKIVYVSCNPATLARDAGVLVHQHGYQLTKAGVMDMFPHTGHVESIALFERS